MSFASLLAATFDASGVAVALVWVSGVLALVWLVAAFNRLVRHRNLVREGWSGIDVQLKRRHDLVPNLVETVKAYASFERRLITDVARLRSAVAAEAPLKVLQENENALTSRLRTVLALAEDYPELLANRSFLDLQEQLVEIEDHLQMARRYYNGTVRDYNIRVESFPSNLVAALFGFAAAEFFEIETATERRAPKVEV